jgi:hypothetical protein
MIRVIIGFRHAKPFAKTSRGQATTGLCARSELDDPRLRHLQLVGALKIIASLDPTDARLNANVVQEIHKARAALLKLIRPEAVFSVMTADFLNSVP